MCWCCVVVSSVAVKVSFCELFRELSLKLNFHVKFLHFLTVLDQSSWSSTRGRSTDSRGTWFTDFFVVILLTKQHRPNAHRNPQTTEPDSISSPFFMFPLPSKSRQKRRAASRNSYGANTSTWKRDTEARRSQQPSTHSPRIAMVVGGRPRERSRKKRISTPLLYFSEWTGPLWLWLDCVSLSLIASCRFIQSNGRSCEHCTVDCHLAQALSQPKPREKRKMKSKGTEEEKKKKKKSH